MQAAALASSAQRPGPTESSASYLPAAFGAEDPGGPSRFEPRPAELNGKLAHPELPGPLSNLKMVAPSDLDALNEDAGNILGLNERLSRYVAFVARLEADNRELSEENAALRAQQSATAAAEEFAAERRGVAELAAEEKLANESALGRLKLELEAAVGTARSGDCSAAYYRGQLDVPPPPRRRRACCPTSCQSASRARRATSTRR